MNEMFKDGDDNAESKRCEKTRVSNIFLHLQKQIN